jgi:hypothetical protein
MIAISNWEYGFLFGIAVLEYAMIIWFITVREKKLRHILQYLKSHQISYDPKYDKKKGGDCIGDNMPVIKCYTQTRANQPQYQHKNKPNHLKRIIKRLATKCKQNPAPDVLSSSDYFCSHEVL